MDKENKTTAKRRAVVIGATSGIGLEVARLLHGDGWTVGLAGRREELLEAIRNEMGNDVNTAVIDVQDEESPVRMLGLIDDMGGADLVFVAAGIGWQNAQLDAAKELATVKTNCEGFTRIVDAAYHYFEKRGRGHIACISSIAGTKGLGAAPAYSATKRFQNTYIQCLAQLARMKGLDVRFTDIRPGFVDTALISGSHFPMTMSVEKTARKIVRAIYARRRKVIIDWRYAILVALWRALPDWLWERMKVG